MWTYFVHMKTATVRDLRNQFATLEAWLAEGEHIEIRKRGEPIAVLSPVPKRRSKRKNKPDFTARLDALWGDRVMSAEEVAAMRDFEREGEEG
jgi:antitoxin (DNA-binding transcriptional repressor) of toxin-antitoxin stability system